jgi:hypothetical protein
MQVRGEPDFGELLDARAALARGLRHAFNESSIIVDWLAANLPTPQHIRAFRLAPEISSEAPPRTGEKLRLARHRIA